MTLSQELNPTVSSIIKARKLNYGLLLLPQTLPRSSYNHNCLLPPTTTKTSQPIFGRFIIETHSYSLIYPLNSISISTRSQERHNLYDLHYKWNKSPTVFIMSATEQFMLLGGSMGLESIGNLAETTAAHFMSSRNSDYQRFIDDADVHYRMIESQLGTAQAEKYREFTILRKESDEQRDTEEVARRAARRAKDNRKPIRRTVVSFCRTLSRLSHRKAETNSSTSSHTAPRPERPACLSIAEAVLLILRNFNPQLSSSSLLQPVLTGSSRLSHLSSLS